jgi:hypothetical protein
MFTRAAESRPNGSEGQRADDQTALITALLFAVAAVSSRGKCIEINVESFAKIFVVVISIVPGASAISVALVARRIFIVAIPAVTVHTGSAAQRAAR